MRLPPLDSQRIEAYLDRLGRPDVCLSPVGLAELQAAHLTAVPFHNLLLLANDGRPRPLPSLHSVVDDAIAGVGGNCDRTTPPFAALLRSIGFDAQLAAATVCEPGDHFICVVHLDGRRYLCDVGNGHPYLRPWDLDGPPQEQSLHGWRFRFEPAAPAGPTLLRELPDGRTKVVYVADPTPRSYASFGPMVSAHYTRAGFGPFLTGLRAVRIQPDAVWSLRDAQYRRDTRLGSTRRLIAGRGAVQSLLTVRFGLPRALVDRALDVVGTRRPDLFQEPRWFALGRGRIDDSRGVQPPPRSALPDVLVSLATVGRHEAVSRLLTSLSEEVRASAYPGRVGVLLIDNQDAAEASGEVDLPGLRVHRLPVQAARPALVRAAEAGVLPDLTGCVPVPIGAAREAQLAVLHNHFAHPIDGLPHPSHHPMVVWMLDDDLAFRQLGPDRRIGRHTHLLYRVARYWAELPQHSVVLGTFTGDPPIPGIDGLGGQLRDLSHNLTTMVRLGPHAPWCPPSLPPPTPDAYYDRTESSESSLGLTWPYAPHKAGVPTREVAVDLLRDLPRLLDGQQLTRPLVWDGTDSPPRPSLRRGGNTLFLDLDALFQWPTPVMASADGGMSRRADTLWAALAQAEDPHAVVEATLPLLHGREGQAPALCRIESAGVGRSTTAQLRGVVLARAVSHGREVRETLRVREDGLRAHRRSLLDALGELRRRLRGLEAWGDPGLDDAQTEAARVLDLLEEWVRAAHPIPSQIDELERFVARLPQAVQAWRGGW